MPGEHIIEALLACMRPFSQLETTASRFLHQTRTQIEL